MTDKEKNNLYKEAHAFYILAKCGQDNIPEENFVESFIPFIVNMSFACELYLKMILINNGKTIDEVKKESHNLYNLYRLLTDEQRNDIYNSFKRPMIYSIEKELKEINSAFADWRYLVLDKANGRQKKMQYKPYFVKEFTQILDEFCANIL